MVEIATQLLPHIEATLNYLAVTGERPVSYAYEPPAGTAWSTAQSEAHRTTIYDLRPAATDLSLDDVGFQLVTHESAVKNFWDEEEIKRVYYPESIDLLKRVTGASEARIFDHTLRRRVPGVDDRAAGVPRQPAARVHVDQTASSGVSRLRLLYPDEADALLARRVAIVNLWRPIKAPVVDSRSASAMPAASRRRISSRLILCSASGAEKSTTSPTTPTIVGSMRQKCAPTRRCS